MSDIDAALKRANAGGKSKSILDQMREADPSGTWNIRTGKKNSPPVIGDRVVPNGEAPPVFPSGPNPAEVAGQRDQAMEAQMADEEAMARWAAAPEKMKAMFHNNFQEYLANKVTTGRDFLAEFPGGMGE
jgi:hypothetical protein